MFSFFSYLAWTLYVVGLVVAVFEVGIEYQTGRASIKDAAISAVKGFMAVGCFTLVPVELYKLSVTLQASLTSGITGYGESFDALSTDIINSLQGVDIGAAASSGVFGGIGSITSPIMVIFIIIMMGTPSSSAFSPTSSAEESYSSRLLWVPCICSRCPAAIWTVLCSGASRSSVCV